MSDFTDNYTNLLILQYADKPKAMAHIETLASEWESIYSFARSFAVEFDLDTAWGDRLDKIGAIVGRSRIVERGYSKNYFGFSGNDNAKTFGAGAFYRILRDSSYEVTELSDEQYRFFIRAKIVKNNVSSRMSSQAGRTGLQGAIDFLFSSNAFITDNKDMTMTLYVDYDYYDSDNVRMLTEEDLIPTPQGVGFDVRIYYKDGTFGFSNNPNAVGFGGGKFARINEPVVNAISDIFSAKSVVFDFHSNHSGIEYDEDWYWVSDPEEYYDEDGEYIGEYVYYSMLEIPRTISTRSIRFFLEGVDVTPSTSESDCHYSAILSEGVHPFYYTDQDTGAATRTAWADWHSRGEDYGLNLNMTRRVSLVADEEFSFDQIVINNGHDAGGGVDIGVKDTTITLSSDDIENGGYNLIEITNATEIFSGVIPAHVELDVEDPYSIPIYMPG